MTWLSMAKVETIALNCYNPEKQTVEIRKGYIQVSRFMLLIFNFSETVFRAIIVFDFGQKFFFRIFEKYLIINCSI